MNEAFILETLTSMHRLQEEKNKFICIFSSCLDWRVRLCMLYIGWMDGWREGWHGLDYIGYARGDDIEYRICGSEPHGSSEVCRGHGLYPSFIRL